MVVLLCRKQYLENEVNFALQKMAGADYLHQICIRYVPPLLRRCIFASSLAVVGMAGAEAVLPPMSVSRR